MARNRKLADRLRATTTPQAGGTTVAARGSALGSKPKSGYQFRQKTGLRAGQDFNIVKGKSGLNIKKYETGDTAIANSDAGVDVAAQRRDVQQRRQVPAPSIGYSINARQLATRLKNRRRRNYDIAV
jgi:hypothetical protein